jgi:integrase
VTAKAPPWSWRLYPLARRAGWTLKYRDGDGVRAEHAVPPKYSDETSAKKYAAAWIDEKKRIAAELEALRRAAPPVAPNKGLTFAKFAELWTKGDLHSRYPDHVAVKTTVGDDKQRLRDHINPILGNIPLEDLAGPAGLERADEVMSKLPALSSQTRRHVAQTMHRIFEMAVYPARLLPANPLPRGWLPKVKSNKARAYLYPDEDAKLLACADVPLVRRLLYGFLAREGCRPSEALRLLRRDLDLGRGAITLDRNKTDDPRAWALSAGVARALEKWWKMFRAESGAETMFFRQDDGTKIDRYNLARVFRAHLALAGVEREALFETSEARKPVRAYDLRATFVTLSLANGKSEAWVAARTGHRSSDMINRYRRIAQSIAELSLGELRPLDQAIPELRDPDDGEAIAMPLVLPDDRDQ